VSELAREERALLTAVEIMRAFAGPIPLPDERRAAMVRRADEIVEATDPGDLRALVLLLGAIGTWGICHLIPKVLPGQDPEDWITSYVQSAFEILDERG
jgi:hypothetical protein